MGKKSRRPNRRKQMASKVRDQETQQRRVDALEEDYQTKKEALAKAAKKLPKSWTTNNLKR